MKLKLCRTRNFEVLHRAERGIEFTHFGQAAYLHAWFYRIALWVFLDRKEMKWVYWAEAKLARVRLCLAIRKHSEFGEVAIVSWGMDCDCAQWADRVVYLPDTLTAVEEWVDRYERNAEGPQGWRLEYPSIADGMVATSRDLALEAYEDGHSWVVRP